MTNLTLRNVKGSALTFSEGDANFANLDSDSPWIVADGRIYYPGNVGIGPNSSNPTYHLDFGTGDSLTNEATIGTSDADLHVHVDGARKFKITTNSQERVTLTTTGKFGIGETNPQFELDVGGYANVSNTLYANNVEANSFTDGTLTISGGSITNAKRIVSTTQIDFTQLYDRSSGYRVNHIDSVIKPSADGFPTTYAVWIKNNDLQNSIDSVNSSLISRTDSLNSSLLAKESDLQSNIDSNHLDILSKSNELQTNIDSVNGSLIFNTGDLQDQIDSLNNLLGNTGLQAVTDAGATTTNTVTIEGDVRTRRLTGSYQGYVGVEFTGSSIQPLNTSGTLASGVVDLGSTTYQLRDAYFSGTINGNVTSADVLSTARTINGTSFDGSTNVITDRWGTPRNITIGDTIKSVNGSGNYSWTTTEIGITKANIDALGIASTTAESLTPGANINGTLFTGASAITTANWGTARDISIGGTSKSVNGSGNYSWSTTEIGITKANIDALGIAATTAGSVTNSFTVQGTSFNGSSAQSVTFSGSTGIDVTGTTITNTAPDQTVSFTNGTGISVTGTYPAFTVTNTAPDQTVSLTGAGGLTVSGTYPNFTLTQGAGAALVAGTGIGISGTTITNTAPDQTVAISQGTGITVTGSYPNFTVANSAPDKTVVLTGGTNVTVTGTYPNFTIASTDTNTTYSVGNGLQFDAAPNDTRISMSGSYTGTFTATGDVVAFSDVALKSNINPITEALERVSQIGGYTYNKLGDDHKRTGVLAQEIQKVLPEAVHTNEDGVLGVAYGNLTGLLIEAVKELNAKVKDLESKLGV